MCTDARQGKHQRGHTEVLTHSHRCGWRCVGTGAHMCISHGRTPLHTQCVHICVHTAARPCTGSALAPAHWLARKQAHAAVRAGVLGAALSPALGGNGAGALLGGEGALALSGKAAVGRSLSRGGAGTGRRSSPQETDSSGLTVWLGKPVRMPPRKLHNSRPPFNLFDLDDDNL